MTAALVAAGCSAEAFDLIANVVDPTATIKEGKTVTDITLNLAFFFSLIFFFFLLVMFFNSLFNNFLIFLVILYTTPTSILLLIQF